MSIMWTKDETEILKKLCKRGRNCREIATVLTTRSNEAIKKKMAENGFAPMKPEINYEAFEKLIKGGKQKCL